MPFKVTKQYPRGGDTFCKEFSNLNDAKAYIGQELGAEVAMSSSTKVVYRIHEFNEVINEYDASNVPAQPAQPEQSGGDQSGGGKGQGATFKPTPFNTTPRPPGSPQNWTHDPDEDEDKKK